MTDIAFLFNGETDGDEGEDEDEGWESGDLEESVDILYDWWCNRYLTQGCLETFLACRVLVQDRYRIGLVRGVLRLLVAGT